ncbi:hypothetical protein DFJ58DRAFT_626943, partial [Suillus subalutaceus]|uniref:uncharacterized protein n=1 Tax=Suillus subalutaceus TaxID=48586 RepID=UPI001B863FD4
YPRTPKKKDQTTHSMTSQDAIERLVKKVIVTHGTIVTQKANPRPKRLRTSPIDHYYIAKYSRESFDLTAWLVDLANDPAVKNFIPRLKDHLLARLRELEYNGDEYNFSDEDRDSVLIGENKLFQHSTL